MIKITGNSKYNVSILEENDIFYVEKKNHPKEDNTRFINQINKHLFFLNNRGYNMIKVPKINTITDNKYIIEYIKSYDIINYFNMMNINHINNFIKNVISFIKELMNQSSLQTVPEEIILNKIDDIKLKLETYSDNFIIKTTFDFLYGNISLFETKIPINYCHGDLTLSNMLINYDHNLYLIDFLDDFINTPLTDIIKLRQDTKYHYILQLYNNSYDKIRIKILLEMMNNIINKQFYKYEKFFKYLDLINFLRILQYSKTKKMDEYLIDTIKNILG